MGKQENIEINENNSFGISSQEDAVISVQNDMKQLNEIICTKLREYNFNPIVIIPHKHFSDTGIEFKGEIQNLFNFNDDTSINERNIFVTYGDVVYCNDNSKFGVLSGDDLIYRIATEVKNVKRVVFAIEGVDGLLETPPESNKPQKLIKYWKDGDGFIGSHNQDIDVTGGIFLKVKRASQIVQKNPSINVTLVRGVYDRVLDALLGNPCICTTITN